MPDTGLVWLCRVKQDPDNVQVRVVCPALGRRALMLFQMSPYETRNIRLDGSGNLLRVLKIHAKPRRRSRRRGAS